MLQEHCQRLLTVPGDIHTQTYKGPHMSWEGLNTKAISRKGRGCDNAMLFSSPKPSLHLSNILQV